MTIPHVVYHVACMGNWPDVVREQFLMLRESGLAGALAGVGDAVAMTHLGPPESLPAVLAEAARHDVPVRVVVSDQNTDHYETLAMIEIERLAKVERTDRPILYMHTKGVSNPGDSAKHLWRRVMGYHVVHKWRENVGYLSDTGGYDACGFNWWNHGEQHFSGTFWVARADWIRRLPNFVPFHHAKGLVRYSCELWIGAAQWCRAYSHGCMNGVTWAHDFNFAPYLSPAAPPPEEITWVSAATPGYAADLARLHASAALLGPGHRMLTQTIREAGPWRHAAKLDALRDLLPAVRTSHVFWIDADCEFLTTLRPRDFIDPAKPLAAVRHLGYDDPRDHVPARLHDRLPAERVPLYWQACLWGGTVGAVSAAIERLRWQSDDPHGYDEHALNIDFQHRPDEVHTLPCRYAAPPDFAPFPQYRESYAARAGGAARVVHHNREIRR